MPDFIRTLLSSRAAEIAARIVLTFPFWGSGLAKLVDVRAGMAEMSAFGLEPAWAFNAAVIAVELGGAALVIANRFTWLGAGALGVFTALTIPVVHHFWSLTGERAQTAFFFATEHVGMIGALVAVSVLSLRPRPAAALPAVIMPQVVPAR